MSLAILGLGLIKSIAWIDLAVRNYDMQKQSIGRLVSQARKVGTDRVSGITQLVTGGASPLENRLSGGGIGRQIEDLLEFMVNLHPVGIFSPFEKLGGPSLDLGVSGQTPALGQAHRMEWKSGRLEGIKNE